MRTRSSLLVSGIGCLLVASAAKAQLREQQVLVVYDSRIADSLAVAEYYAGSAKVPGGAGALPGVRPNVQVLDISTRTSTAPGGGPAGVFPFLTGPSTFSADITYATFRTQLRDPLRSYLWTTGLARRIRCVVLTKGLPHRIINMGAIPGLGDNPGQINSEFSAGNGGNFTFASVDSELTLLYQSLDAGEAGGIADSRADGAIANPFWSSSVAIEAWSTRDITQIKTFAAAANNEGIIWLNHTAPGPATLTPGDMYLVCRLDGQSVSAVRSMIDRAQNLVFNTSTSGFVFDNDGRGFDNAGPPGGPTSLLNNGADFQQASNAIIFDGRYISGSVTFNNAGSYSAFVVGPLVAYPPTPLIVSRPLLMLSSMGANHTGVSGAPATTYATSFNLQPGAVFHSIESYNGRDFGNLGQNPFAPQQQASSALAAGFTFAVANVWEPLANTVSDQFRIAQNFYLGNMSWAEAAYTSLPVLSWQQIVLGDPLARPRRDRDDINGDGRVNIDDLYAQTLTPIDLNRDTGINNGDFVLLEATVRANEVANMKARQR